MADEILKRSDSKLAKELGYELCQCTYPPQIMLWDQKRQAYYCPNPDCGRLDQMGEEIQIMPASGYDPHEF